MKLKIKKISRNPVNMLRQAGYTFQRSEKEEMSFVRSFSSSGYPRFHIYAKTMGENLEISIHLDRKKETYGHNTRHHGEYENEDLLAKEVKRLKIFLK